jgi:hypothetical protein
MINETNALHPIFDPDHVARMTRVKAIAPPDPGWRYRHEVARRLDALMRVALMPRGMAPTSDRNEV